jgi:hypothetical protein
MRLSLQSTHNYKRDFHFIRRILVFLYLSILKEFSKLMRLSLQSIQKRFFHFIRRILEKSHIFFSVCDLYIQHTFDYLFGLFHFILVYIWEMNLSNVKKVKTTFYLSVFLKALVKLFNLIFVTNASFEVNLIASKVKRQQQVLIAFLLECYIIVVHESKSRRFYFDPGFPHRYHVCDFKNRLKLSLCILPPCISTFLY